MVQGLQPNDTIGHCGIFTLTRVSKRGRHTDAHFLKSFHILRKILAFAQHQVKIMQKILKVKNLKCYPVLTKKSEDELSEEFQRIVNAARLQESAVAIDCHLGHSLRPPGWFTAEQGPFPSRAPSFIMNHMVRLTVVFKMKIQKKKL